MGQATPFAMLALSGLGTAQSMSEAQRRRRIAMANSRLDQARSNLELAQQRHGSAFGLGKKLSEQAVQGSARGVAQTSGSLMRQALIASRQARRQAGLAQGAAALRDAGIQLADADAAGRAGAASTRALISFGESAVRHGSSVIG